MRNTCEEKQIAKVGHYNDKQVVLLYRWSLKLKQAWLNEKQRVKDIIKENDMEKEGRGEGEWSEDDSKKEEGRVGDREREGK